MTTGNSNYKVLTFCGLSSVFVTSAGGFDFDVCNYWSHTNWVNFVILMKGS